MTASAERRPWWNALLIASLALNLLFGGAVVTRFFMHGPVERMAGTSYLQLVPRKFFADLGRPRREELLGVLKNYRDRFRAGQQNSRVVAESLADALDATPYDEARLRAVVEAFGKNGSDLIGLGSQAALDFISRLSPEERNRLAETIRERAKGSRRK
jgi:uncharacterized membrane protein